MSRAALRQMLARPASLLDVLEAWMITNPQQRKQATQDNHAGQAQLRRAMKEQGAEDPAVLFWSEAD